MCPSLRISGQLQALIVNGEEDSFWKWPDFQLWRARDLDLDVGSGHTAHRRASLSLINLYVLEVCPGRAARKPGPYGPGQADNLLISNGPGRATFFAGRAGKYRPYMARRQKMPRDMFIYAKAQLCIKSA